MRDKNTDSHFKNIVEPDGEFIPIIAEDSSDLLNKDDMPELLSVLPLRNTVLFPGVVIPIAVGRKKSLELIKEANAGKKIIGTVAQKDARVEDPELDEIYNIGTVAKIVKILEMPDGTTSVIIQGQGRFSIDEMVEDQPYFKAKVSVLTEELPEEDDKEFEAIVSSLKELSAQIVKLSDDIPPEAVFAIKNIDNAPFLSNYISSNMDIAAEKKQELLEIDNLKRRSIRLLEHLAEEVQKVKLKNDIQSKVKVDIDQQQREYFLNQQMKTIQNELGGNPQDAEIKALNKKAKKKKWNKKVAKRFKKEVDRLQFINPSSPEYANQMTYLQTLLDLPWKKYTKDNFELKHAEDVLDEDHFGLDQVKERILEHLAVLKLKKNLKVPIICLYGPPGVGKTSLGKSIAKSLGRKYTRMSLGGLHDEAEIRGHRKTYIGALPGRIIQNIAKVKSSNPVFVLDEIDKVGADFRGDPSFALLEVLDPEQNKAFYDNYLELEYDLSKVMFVATANSISTIKPALLDRMELINVTGYIVEEKKEIAKRHLLPVQLKDHGVSTKQLQLSDEILEHIVTHYTRESGVRRLNQVLSTVVRKVAKKIAFEEEYENKPTIEDIHEMLGAPKFINDTYQGNEYAGVVTGLAWTSVGGQILFVESSLSKGSGKLTLTGNLGAVMKESAILALEYLKAHSKELNIDSRVFDLWNIHVHVPEGAIPKDGPSAGITMATSLASVLTQRKVKKNVAMTGEITLRGKVLPVGGIKEKILAAKRANIKEIILSEENRKDIEEIKNIYIKGVKFHYVKNVLEVIDLALMKKKVDSPLDMKIKEPKEKTKE